MKPSSQAPGKPSRLSCSVHHQLNMYALAASATGVSILALAPTADARIVYHHTHRMISAFTLYHLDLNKRGVTDFIIRNSQSVHSDGATNSLLIRGAAGNAVVMKSVGEDFFALALKRGTPISSAIYESALMAVQGRTSGGPAAATFTYGPWANVTGRYLGLKFQIHGATHYGWARLNVRVSKTKFSITATLTGYAYETIPNKPIIAGKTKGPDVITLEPGSLGRLALGSSGIPAGRSGK